MELELKNILIKNNQPLYAQKEKGFIADKIASAVDDNVLRGQIAYELVHRNYSVFDAKDYTIYSNNGEDFLAEELVDMLSEKNLNEFTLDKWIELYKHASDIKEMKTNMKMSDHIITKRREHKVPYTDIEVYPGVPWVSADIMNDFVYHLLGQTYRIFDGIKTRIDYVFYEPVTGYWAIRNKKNLRNVNCEVNYGTYRYNALQILEATMNLREIRIYDKGNNYNEKETLAALEKQKLLIDEFRRWIWDDEDRRWLVEEAYNNLFDTYKFLKLSAGTTYKVRVTAYKTILGKNQYSLSSTTLVTATPTLTVSSTTKGSCINFRNNNTIEFRMFGGTLKYNTIIATLQLVNRVCDVAVALPDDEIRQMSWTTFFIKPTNYERSKTRKFKSNMNLRENMPYDAEKDEYICKNGKRLMATYTGPKKADIKDRLHTMNVKAARDVRIRKLYQSKGKQKNASIKKVHRTKGRIERENNF